MTETDQGPAWLPEVSGGEPSSSEIPPSREHRAIEPLLIEGGEGPPKKLWKAIEATLRQEGIIRS